MTGNRDNGEGDGGEKIDSGPLSFLDVTEDSRFTVETMIFVIHER